MRIDLGQTINAKPGEVVWIRARLPKALRSADKHARITIWSCNPGFDFSPHIQIAAMGLVKDGKPDMVPPMRMMLNSTTPVKEISFIADERLDFQVRQEVDRADEPLVKVKVKRYNVRVYRFIQRVKNFVSAFRAKGLVHQ